MTGRLRDLVVAVLIGALGAVAGLAAYDVWRDQRAPALAPVGDRVQRAADALADGDRVYVAADAHDLVPPDVEERLETLAADSAIPVYLVAWEASREAGYGGIWDAAGQLQRLVDEEAVYVIYRGPGDGLITDNVDGGLEGDVPDDFNGDAARRLEEILTAIGEVRRSPGDDWSYWGGPLGVAAAGAIIAGGVISVILLLVGLVRLALGRRFRMVGTWW
ncbi:hypothetical protein [Nocardioides sp. W7]|uniref:hypothetical protein n=1 Tax=Nocardioides sp. W7 TaxID=2931390 RepID=UPI001FD3228E|nr:hypothetical protein [Nocardioides sp. W7]